MAKKKPATKQEKKTPYDGVQRIEARIKPEQYEAMTRLAEEAGVSLNQLMGGVVEWVINNAMVGKLIRNDADGTVALDREAKQIVSFGRERIGVRQYYDGFDWAAVPPDGDIPWVAGQGQKEERFHTTNERNKGAIYGMLDFNPSVAKEGD